jgi:hypothetical protein
MKNNVALHGEEATPLPERILRKPMRTSIEISLWFSRAEPL